MSMRANIRFLALVFMIPGMGRAVAQCTDYDIIVGGGSGQGQVHWELMDAFGNIVAAGDAPENTGECLPDGCYTMIMYDDNNNGWQGNTWSINYENTSIVVASGTLSSGGYGTQVVDLNGNCGSSGCQDQHIVVTSGSSHNDVYWEIVDEFGSLIASGGSPDDQVICMPDGCFTVYMYDSNGDGWEGATWTVTDVATGTVNGSGTLPSGGYGTSQLIIGAGCGSCTFYDLEVTAGAFPGEISWDMYDALGNFIAAGGAPTLEPLCLADGCYTFYAYDASGDGWNGAEFTFTDSGNGAVIATGTLLNSGFGSFQVSIGAGCGTGSCTQHTLVVTGGSAPGDVSWNFSAMGISYASGWAPATVQFCIDTGCYVMQMFDAVGNGWQGATWTLLDQFGVVEQTGTLASGSTGADPVPLGNGDCTVPVAVTASDCPQAVNVCTNLNFTIDPNGWGAIWEIPALGSMSNPEFYFGDGLLSPWGTDHYGCLMGQEINTTWMIVNISGSGTLEFTLGANNTQAGFYDWTMFPYTANTCGQILANTIAPVRCNWNYSSSGGTGITSTVPPGGFPENFETPLNVTAGQRYIICFSNWSSVTTVVPLVFGGTATVSCDPVILPVELLYFTATPNGPVVDIDWATASEKNTSHFIVQRSPDGETWSDLQRTQAMGNASTTHLYEATDILPIEGDSYYRLVAVDLDGSTDRSRNVKVNWSTITLRLWPNPANDELWLDLGDHADAAIITLGDGTGRAHRVPHERAGTDEVRLGLHELEPGVYSITAQDGEWIRSARVVVLER